MQTALPGTPKFCCDAAYCASAKSADGGLKLSDNVDLSAPAEINAWPARQIAEMAVEFGQESDITVLTLTLSPQGVLVPA